MPSGSVLLSVRTVVLRFHVVKGLVAYSIAHRLHASDTPLKNARVVGAPVNVAGNPSHVDRNANKKTYFFDTIPTVFKQCSNSTQKSFPIITKLTNRKKTVFVKLSKQYLNSFYAVQILFEYCLKISERLSCKLFPLLSVHVDIFQILFAVLFVHGDFLVLQIIT